MSWRETERGRAKVNRVRTGVHDTKSFPCSRERPEAVTSSDIIHATRAVVESAAARLSVRTSKIYTNTYTTGALGGTTLVFVAAPCPEHKRRRARTIVEEGVRDAAVRSVSRVMVSCSDGS